MSIATRTGDTGTTGMLYNRRLPKYHPRVEALGSVDELNSAIGLARALCGPASSPTISSIQKDLVNVMGEIATMTEDLPRYQKDGFITLTAALTERLDKLVAEIEGQGISYKGWATPGATAGSGALDVARTTCRRAERRIHALHETGEIPNSEMLIYFNRLSDVLWLMARWVETKTA